MLVNPLENLAMNTHMVKINLRGVFLNLFQTFTSNYFLKILFHNSIISAKCVTQITVVYITVFICIAIQ